MTSKTVKIAQLTDIHVEDWSGFRRRDLINKRVTGWVNYRFLRKSHHCADVLSLAIARVIEEQPDIVLVTGDLTNIATEVEMHAARAMLQPIADAGIEMRVIPGNHDYYVRSATRGPFERIFADWMHADVREAGTHYPYVVRVGPVSCVLANSAIATGPMLAYGRIGKPQMARLERQIEGEVARGQHVLVAAHHHPIRATHKRWDATRNLKDAAAYRAVLTRAGAEVVLHGHNHFSHVTRLGSDGPIIVGLSSSSTTRDDRPERRGQVGLYTFEDGQWDLSFGAYEPRTGQFGDIASLPIDFLTVTDH